MDLGRVSGRDRGVVACVQRDSNAFSHNAQNAPGRGDSAQTDLQTALIIDTSPCYIIMSPPVVLAEVEEVDVGAVRIQGSNDGP
jgi:hypothetical protein